MEPSRVAQGEDHRPIDVLSHLFDDLLRESLGLSGGADQHMRLDLFDNRKKILMVLAFPIRVIPSVWDLPVREFVALRFEEEAWLVDTPDLLYGIFFRPPTFSGHGVPHLICDACTGAPRAEDHESYVL